MAKDPAFLYYDADASKDMSHMNRLERGGYVDIIHAQKKFGRLSIDVIKKVLGKDFNDIWHAIELILTRENDLFFIEWLDQSIEKRKHHAKIQKERIVKYWKEKVKQSDTTEIPRNKSGKTTDIPLENENVIEIIVEDNDGGMGEEKGEEKFLVPQMQQVFVKANPTYPLSREHDYPALLKISTFITNQNKGQPPDNEEIIAIWEQVSRHISESQFYSQKSLKTISTHIQNLYQETFNPKVNGSQSHTGRKERPTEAEAYHKFVHGGKQGNRSP